MRLYSTNDRNLIASFREAVLKGLAPDGGLYMPEHIPSMPPEFWQRVSSMSFQDISFEIAKTLIGDEIPDDVLRAIINEAINFDAPLVRLTTSPDPRSPALAGRGDGEGLYVLELFHGPTLAFKDFAARTMARLMSYFVSGADRELTILVATSGDTGSAVAQGFLNVPGIRVIILYPSGAVSPNQEKMLTTMGGNITALEIQGTFDDCQKLVKQAFVNPELSARLWLSSANSISIARLIPQMFYYAWAYAQLLKRHSPIRTNERVRQKEIVFSVPSGNFGNLTAGLIAKRMGLPVAKFVAASNANDVIPEYLRTGDYKPRPSQKTLSNAMDVGAPSNFARMLELYGNDVGAMRRDIWGIGCSDEQTRATMKEVYERYGYVLDPHGAVGYWGLKQYQIYGGKASGAPEALPRDIGIVLETAHPAKFSETVQETLGISVEVPQRMQEYLQKEKQSTLLPNDLDALKQVIV